MNSPTIVNAITPSSWFLNLHFSKSPNDTSTPSKVEILFLFDCGASISSLILPTYNLLAERFLYCCSDIQHYSSKTITVANKAQLPILFNIYLTCHTSINKDSRTFIIPFAVVNTRYNIFGTLLSFLFNSQRYPQLSYSLLSFRCS